jgi:H-type lectin domain
MGIDSLGGVNTRVKLSVFDVTAAGFKVNMEAWWDSIVYGIWHTEPVLNPGLVRIFPLHSYELRGELFIANRCAARELIWWPTGYVHCVIVARRSSSTK